MPERMPSQPDIPMAAGASEERRMGARATTKFSVFLIAGERRVRGRTVELSTTGIVIDFSYYGRPEIDGPQTLELVVPGLGRPIKTRARPVRRVGKFDAFEFVSIRPVDRLSLAEHLDRERRLGNVGS
ncbi:MAG TPA: PilZ domain-containing protein [Polyangiaceae bacterium]|nr:PilZ domain-containing protein [Polyangiaceae bacterium]